MTTELAQPQVFLPYFNPVLEHEGWQFGLPPVSSSGLLQSTCGVALLLDDGRTGRVEQARFTPPTTEAPGEPIWAWVPVERDDGLCYACVSAPRPKNGGPVREALRYDTRLLTPRGAETEGERHSGFDLPCDIPSQHEEGAYTVQLGPHELGKVEVRASHVHAFYPSDLVEEIGLWNVHLARILQVTS